MTIGTDPHPDSNENDEQLIDDDWNGPRERVYDHKFFPVVFRITILPHVDRAEAEPLTIISLSRPSIAQMAQVRFNSNFKAGLANIRFSLTGVHIVGIWLTQNHNLRIREQG